MRFHDMTSIDKWCSAFTGATFLYAKIWICNQQVCLYFAPLRWNFGDQVCEKAICRRSWRFYLEGHISALPALKHSVKYYSMRAQPYADVEKLGSMHASFSCVKSICIIEYYLENLEDDRTQYLKWQHRGHFGSVRKSSHLWKQKKKNK